MIDKRGTNASAQLTKWKDYMVEMGYGYRLGIDLPTKAGDSYRTPISTASRSAGPTGAPTP